MQNMPSLGAGTFRLEGAAAYNSVKLALECGYRHIDTAQIYGNEAEVGQAIADSGISRDEIFITTKVWLDYLDENSFISSVQQSLEKLKVSWVDLLLIHWPDISEKVSMQTYLSMLARAEELGFTRKIGVSNFTIAQLDEAIQILGAGKIYTNQVEVHPYLQNDKVVAHCKANNVKVTGYMPLAVGRIMQDPTLLRIASTHNVSVAEVAIAWQLQRGLTTIPSSTKKINLETNLQALELTLSDDDMAEIKMLNKNERIANPEFSPYWD